MCRLRGKVAFNALCNILSSQEAIGRKIAFDERQWSDATLRCGAMLCCGATTDDARSCLPDGCLRRVAERERCGRHRIVQLS